MFQIGIKSTKVMLNIFPELMDTYSFYTGNISTCERFISNLILREERPNGLQK